MTNIIEINNYSTEYHEAMQRFLDQLTTNPITLTETMFRQLLESENSHLFFLMKDKQIAGMLTIGIYHSPTGGKAWIEDVVVDTPFRGQGLSKLLVAHAIEFTKSKGIPSLMLTSNPKRIAANKLYQTMEFRRKETNVYRMVFFIIFLCIIGILHGKNKTLEEVRTLIQNSWNVQYSNPKQSAYYANQAINLINENGKNNIKAEAMFALGNAQKLLGEFDQGIQTLYESLEYVTPNNKELEGSIYSLMCVLYCRLSDYQQAMTLNDKAMTIFKQTGDSAQIAVCYNSRGIIHTYLNEFDIAESFFRQALSINRSIKDLKKVAANLNNLCLYEGNTKEKLGFIQEAITINKNLNSQWSLAENYNNKGKQYFYAKNYSRALEALEQAYDIAQTIEAKDLICDNYEYSSWIYAALDNYPQAYKYLQQLTRLSKELHSSTLLRNIEKEINQKSFLKERQAAKLKEQAYEIALLKRSQYTTFIILTSLIIVCVFVYKWYKRKKRMELMETQYQLEQSEKEIVELKVRQQELELQSAQNELINSRQEATNFAVFLQSRNELLDKIREMIKEGYKLNENEISAHLKKINAFIKQYQNGDKNNSSLLLSIEEKNQEFLIRLTKLHPNLTRGEKHLATLLRVNLSTKDIAMLTGTMPKTINMNRYRLRKSLELPPDNDLVQYLQEI